jgi:hypothetical protein
MTSMTTAAWIRRWMMNPAMLGGGHPVLARFPRS